MSNCLYSGSESDIENNDYLYCIFLHIVEGIGMQQKPCGVDFSERHKENIIVNASLNGVKFEVEGHQTETVTMFNSNCVWECELSDLKRMKTDNRPVKLECFLKSADSENSPRILIGSLLLPLRGLQTMNDLKDTHFKMRWHKFGALNSEWRENKPEIYLLLLIVRKPLFETGQLELMIKRMKCSGLPTFTNEILSPNVTETALMLQSQSNIYVQLLEQIGVIQVGNNADIDCDIFHVSFTFKQLKNVANLVDLERNDNKQLMAGFFVLQYDFFGSVSTLEIDPHPSDCYGINEKISLSFKSSLTSLRAYFQRIFYMPINLYWNGKAIAYYRLDFTKLLPDDVYFDGHKQWVKNGAFYFERLRKIHSPHVNQSYVDFVFAIQLAQSYAVKKSLNETSKPMKGCELGAGDMPDCCCHLPGESSRSRREYKAVQPIGVELLLSNETPCSGNERTTQNLWKNNEPIALNITEAVQRIQIKKEADETTTVDRPVAIKSDFIEKVTPADSEMRTIGVNTDALYYDYPSTINTDALYYDHPSTINTDDMLYKIVQELEEWKAQQIEHFLEHLQRKEAAHLFAVDEESRQQRIELQSRLNTKLEQCDELNKQLERAFLEIKAEQSSREKSQDSAEIMMIAKMEVEKTYAQRFQALDTQMKRLKLEMQQQGAIFEMQHERIQREKTQLAVDKQQLKRQSDQLEQQLVAMKQTHISADQLKIVLADVRTQNETYAEIDQLRIYYKDEWSKTTRELHKLQLLHIECQKNCLNQKQDLVKANEQICLEEILHEERDALHGDRTELKSIKDVFLPSDETSSSGEPDILQQ